MKYQDFGRIKTKKKSANCEKAHKIKTVEKSSMIYEDGKRERSKMAKKNNKVKENHIVGEKDKLSCEKKGEGVGASAKDDAAEKSAFELYLEIFRSRLPLDESFDLLERKLMIGGCRASVFFVDGLHDSDKALELFKYLLAVPDEAMEGIRSSQEFLERNLPFMEAEVVKVARAGGEAAGSGRSLMEDESGQPAACSSQADSTVPAAKALAAHAAASHSAPYSATQLRNHCLVQYSAVLPKLYTGLVPLIVEGLDDIIIMDVRHYPARSVEEPEKEKTLRGAKDGFTEALMTNIGLIRRRIRDNALIFKTYNVGSLSKSDVALVYMNDRADMEFVRKLETVFSEWGAETRSIKPQRSVSTESEPGAEMSSAERQRNAAQPTADRGSASAEANDRSRRQTADTIAVNSPKDMPLCGAAVDEQPEQLPSSPVCPDSLGTQGQRCLSALLRSVGRVGRKRRLDSAEATDAALTASEQSLLERLTTALDAGSGINPFPKVRYTQRPDVVAAHLTEGKTAIITDNSPTAMLIPTSLFEFFQDSDDYYLPQLTGNYFRMIRLLNFFVILFLTPIFCLMSEYEGFAPELLRFFVPAESFAIPIFWQFILLEIAVDGLKLASLNTPSSLATSLSLIGALILGELSIGSGWFIPQTILCMAVVALAAFTQPSIELSYAMKFCRIGLLIGVHLGGGYGLVLVTAIVFAVIAQTKTLSGGSYLYPLIPFDAKILKRLIFRTQK